MNANTIYKQLLEVHVLLYNNYIYNYHYIYNLFVCYKKSLCFINKTFFNIEFKHIFFCLLIKIKCFSISK